MCARMYPTLHAFVEPPGTCRRARRADRRRDTRAIARTLDEATRVRILSRRATVLRTGPTIARRAPVLVRGMIDATNMSPSVRHALRALALLVSAGIVLAQPAAPSWR